MLLGTDALPLFWPRFDRYNQRSLTCGQRPQHRYKILLPNSRGSSVFILFPRVLHSRQWQRGIYFFMHLAHFFCSTAPRLGTSDSNIFRVTVLIEETKLRSFPGS